MFTLNEDGILIIAEQLKKLSIWSQLRNYPKESNVSSAAKFRKINEFHKFKLVTAGSYHLNRVEFKSKFIAVNLSCYVAPKSNCNIDKLF